MVGYLGYLAHLIKGVLIIGSADISATNMLIFTVLVIGTVNQGKPIQVLIIVHVFNAHQEECCS